MVDATDVFPTPGGPDSNKVFPLGDPRSLDTAKNSNTRVLTWSKPKCDDFNTSSAFFKENSS
jgi:hypothetical protein